MLADVYHLSQQAMAYACEPELYWVIVTVAARRLKMPTIRAVNEAADVLRPRLEDGSNDLRGMYGSLNLRAAVTFAREGRDGDAWRHWDQADAVVEHLPSDYAH